MSKFRQGEKGSVLLVSLIAVMVLASASAAFLSITLHRNREATASHEKLLALYIAETGLSASVAEMKAKHDYDNDGLGVASGSFAGGSYSVTVVDSGSDVWVLTSTGTYKSETRNIEIVIKRVPGSLFTEAAFGITGVVLIGDAFCDSYDSDAGSYESQKSGDYANENGDVRSNGNIWGAGNMKVYGDAIPGPEETVYIMGNFYVLGATAPAEAEKEVEPYTYDPEGGNLGELRLAGANTQTIAAGTCRYSCIKLGANAILTLGSFEGDEVTLYVDGKFEITGSSKLYVHPGVKVVIHHGSGRITLAGNSVVNDSGTPANFVIYSATASAVRFTGNNDLHGAIYAPNAPVGLIGDSDLFGSVTGARVTMTGNGDLHYDEALSSLGSGASESYQTLSWRELP